MKRGEGRRARTGMSAPHSAGGGYSLLRPPRRRKKINAPKAITKPAQTMRTTEESMDGYSFLALLIGQLHVFDHRNEIPHEPRQHGANRHHEQRRQHTEENRENQLDRQL